MRLTAYIFLLLIFCYPGNSFGRSFFDNNPTATNTLPVPQITSDKSVYCEDDIATLTENVPVAAGYTINWYLNGVLIAGDQNKLSIQTSDAGGYTVVITDNIAADAQTSQPFELEFVLPPFIGTFAPEARVCNTGTLRVVPIGIITHPFVYRWYTNGFLNGDVDDHLVVTKSGLYRVEISICGETWVSSNAIQVDVVNLPIPVLTSDKTIYCTGDNATLSINAPADASYTINWYRNNTLIPEYANKTSVTTNVAGSYTVSIVNNAPNYDGTYCTETTTPQNITFNASPTVNIAKSVNTSLCDGQMANLSASYTGGTIQWSTGQNTDQIAVTSTGTYTATVTSSSGCTATASVSIIFFSNPVLNISDVAFCQYKYKSVTLVAPPGYAEYNWNGQPGGSSYQVNSAQTVTLVVTDINGCTATQQIQVTDSCPNLVIPNVFTPNDDRINDTWIIEGIPENLDLRVMIFDRYGAKLYDNTGYSVPWDGEYRGKKVPAGVYYYLINVPSKNKTYSGPITVLY